MDKGKIRQLIGELNENIIADAFESHVIASGKLAERLIMERKAAAEALSALLEEVEEAKQTIHFCYPNPETGRPTQSLYNMGDCRCIWINEGDLWMRAPYLEKME